MEFSKEFEKFFEGWLSRHESELVEMHKKIMWDAWQAREAAQPKFAPDVACESCKLEFTSSCPIRTGNGCDLYQPRR